MSKKRHPRNLRPAVIILTFPLLIGAFTFFLLFNNQYKQVLGSVGASRLVTDNWQVADAEFNKHTPEYGRKYAYYQLKESENLAKLSQHFSVPESKISELNPGSIVAGTTVKITPVEAPLQPTSGPNGRLSSTRVLEQDGILKVRNDFKFEKVITNIPELARYLQRYNAISQTGPKSFLVNRPISLEENIRLDVTNQTVDSLQLRSSPNSDVTCLCLEDAELLIKDTQITSFDPATGRPDYKASDDRSFIRALKTSRMDIVNSRVSYLGGVLHRNTQNALLRKGAVYGVTWRIPDTQLGKDIATGWVQNSTFYKNHFGSYTFGASGMVWRDNHFSQNDVYGLDPHDDSNNALVEGNVFEHNGKHGFIVSKRCNYNVIRNNISYGNALHGFMLHKDSAYNVIENNVAYDNVDNFAIYDSDFNMIRNNRGYNARGNHVRINQNSTNTFVINNTFYGGKRGIYIYGNSMNVRIKGNNIQSVGNTLATNGAKNVLFANNTLTELGYKIAANDRLIFGPNSVMSNRPALAKGVKTIWIGKPDNIQPADTD